MAAHSDAPPGSHFRSSDDATCTKSPCQAHDTLCQPTKAATTRPCGTSTDTSTDTDAISSASASGASSAGAAAAGLVQLPCGRLVTQAEVAAMRGGAAQSDGQTEKCAAQVAREEAGWRRVVRNFTPS